MTGLTFKWFKVVLGLVSKDLRQDLLLMTKDFDLDLFWTSDDLRQDLTSFKWLGLRCLSRLFLTQDPTWFPSLSGMVWHGLVMNDFGLWLVRVLNDLNWVAHYLTWMCFMTWDLTWTPLDLNFLQMTCRLALNDSRVEMNMMSFWPHSSWWSRLHSNGLWGSWVM